MNKIVLSLVCISIMLSARDGALDTTFGTNGIVTTSLGGSDQAKALIVQPDGRIVAVGDSDGSGFFDFALVRYMSNGLLDTSFGVGGKAITHLAGNNIFAFAVVLQPDGKIVAGGFSSSDFMLVRYNSDGSLDTTFGSGGIVITDLGGTDEAYALLLQPDGRIIAAGFSNVSGTEDFALVRYNSDGSLDTSFGSGGIVITNLGGDNERAFAVLLQPDGRIVAAGFASGASDFALVRYNSDGSLDTSFGSGGIVITNLGGDDEQANAVLLQPDGRIVAGGFSDASGANDFALVRYNSDGSLDASFGTGGIVITNLGGNDEQANAVVLQPDGRIVATGFTNASGANDFALVRYNIDGTLDTTFGTNGIVTTNLGGADDKIQGAFVQADGSIVVAGFTNVAGNYDFALARYLIPSIEVSSLARDLRAKYLIPQRVLLQ